VDFVSLPCEIEEELLEDTLKEVEILAAIYLPLNLKSPKDSPCMDRRIDVPKIPLVGRDLTEKLVN